MQFQNYTVFRDASKEYSSHLALISASRHERKAQINDLFTNQLHDSIVNMGWKASPVMGSWKESGKKENVKEKSFLVLAQAVSPEAFDETIIAWLNQYNQEAALVRYAHDHTIWLLTSAGNKFNKGLIY